MGKITGMLQYVGKVGNTVGMKGSDGENYVRINVKPANPKSQAQVDQRVKMALAGLLSKLTDRNLIIGMGNTTRRRRTNFTSLITRMATTQEVDGVVRALLAPEDLIFSEGRVIPVDTENLSTTFNGSKLQVTYGQTALPTDIAAYLIIGAFSKGEEYIQIDGAVITNTTLSVDIPGQGEAVNVYVVPITRADGATSTSYERAVIDIETSNDYAAVARGAVAGSLYYGGSAYLGRTRQP